MVVSDGEDDWNSESSEDDGEGQRCDDEVEEVIQSLDGNPDTRVTGLGYPVTLVTGYCFFLEGDNFF